MDIYAPLAGRMGMQGHARGARETCPSGTSIRRLTRTVYQAPPGAPSANEGADQEDRGGTERAPSGRGAYGITGQGRQKKPYSFSARCSRNALLRASSRMLGLSHHRQRHSVLLSRRSVSCTPLACRAGTLQGLHLDPETERLSIDSHDIIGPSRQRIELARSATKRMHEIAEYGIAAHALYKDRDTVSGDLTRHCRHRMPIPGCAGRSNRSPRATIRRSFSSTPSSNSSRIRFSASQPKGN